MATIGIKGLKGDYTHALDCLTAGYVCVCVSANVAQLSSDCAMQMHSHSTVLQ